MTTIILSSGIKTISGITYNSFEVQHGKKSASIMLCKSSWCEWITVLPHTASTRVFRSLGKDFDTVELALQHYKSVAMQSMIRATQTQPH